MRIFRFQGRSGYLARIACLCGVFGLLAGCHNIYLAEPTVLAPQDQFKLGYTVRNRTDKAVPVDAIKVKIRSQYFTKGNVTCNTIEYQGNPRVEPGDEWTVEDVEFSASSPAVGDPCYCGKSRDCQGNVWVTLLDAKSNDQLSGHLTNLQIHFGGSETL